MPASAFDSVIYRELLFDSEIGQCFGEDSEIAAMIRVEVALARAQGALGMIPAASASAIEKACGKAEIEAASLAAGTSTAGIPIPALIDALRKAVGNPEHAAYLHWGATSQDIMDTGLVLRLREVCDIVEARLQLLLNALADLADAHAELPLAARTRRQAATPTSFGAVVSAWGAPLLQQLDALAQLRPRLLRLSLAGASGNASALGDDAAELRAVVANELAVGASDACWHSDRSALAEFASLLTRVNGALAKLGEDCLFGAQAEVGELKLASGGGSSTMPHKQNPVQAETLLSLFQLAAALEGAMTQTLVHRQQRDGAAWMLEWLALPQICMAAGRALQIAVSMVTRMEPVAERMRANLEGRHGLVYAEAISFRLAAEIPRPDAQAAVKRLCADALARDCRLLDLVVKKYSKIDWSEVVNPSAQLGDAPAQARAFAALARKRAG